MVAGKLKTAVPPTGVAGSFSVSADFSLPVAASESLLAAAFGFRRFPGGSQSASLLPVNKEVQKQIGVYNIACKNKNY